VVAASSIGRCDRDMNVALAFTLNDADDKMHALHELNDSLVKHFGCTDYGGGISEVYIGIICVRPEFGQFFEERRATVSSYGNATSIEMEITLDYELVHRMSPDVTIDHVKRAISLRCDDLCDLGIPSFECDRFVSDLRAALSSR
jgi:hypothetical protein